METLKAGTQYGDFEGTAAADDGNDPGVVSFLADKGVIGPNDYLAGFDINGGESASGLTIRALIAEANSFDTFKAALDAGSSLSLRRVDVDLTIDEFVELFKRFNIVVTRSGLNLAGRDYDIIQPN